VNFCPPEFNSFVKDVVLFMGGSSNIIFSIIRGKFQVSSLLDQKKKRNLSISTIVMVVTHTFDMHWYKVEFKIPHFSTLSVSFGVKFVRRKKKEFCTVIRQSFDCN
jgi:hypothetical protein